MNPTISFPGKTLCMFLFIVIAFPFNYSYAQKDKDIKTDKYVHKIARENIQVRTAKFQSEELKNATADYKAMMKSGPATKNAIVSLRNKGYSNAVILGSLRYVKIRDLTLNIVSNTEVADDAQLMLKAIPTLTAAEMITAIRELYDVSTVKLLNIILLTSQDSVVRVNEYKYFTNLCDCKKNNYSSTPANLAVRKSIIKSVTSSGYFKKLYPWQCFDYWNTGLRSVILPETNLNDYLRQLKMSEYPFYEGIRSTDLEDPSIDFKIIMGNTAEDLSELMTCATLAYLPPWNWTCNMEYPFSSHTYLDGENYYTGTCYERSFLTTRFFLKAILGVLKRNGFSMTIMATAAKTRFNPPDDDLKQRILAQFETSVFSAAEILQASNVLNSN